MNANPNIWQCAETTETACFFEKQPATAEAAGRVQVDFRARLAPHRVPIIGGLTMSKNISKLPRGKNQIPIDIVRSRLRNHVEFVVASNNEVLIRMIERFFIEMTDRLVLDTRSERPKAPVVPIRPKGKED
jgi:hypothetical protein